MSDEVDTPLDPSAIASGTNVLVGGSADRSWLFVTTKKSAAQIKQEFDEGRDVAD